MFEKKIFKHIKILFIGGLGTALGSWDQKHGTEPLVCINDV